MVGKEYVWKREPSVRNLVCGMARGIGREAPPPQRPEVGIWSACRFAAGGVQQRALRGFGELGVGGPQPVGEEHRLHLREDVPHTARGYHLMYMRLRNAEMTMVENTAE